MFNPTDILSPFMSFYTLDLFFYKFDQFIEKPDLMYSRARFIQIE
jgi:hypothetical protein